VGTFFLRVVVLPTMGVASLQCPECGASVKMGLPMNATVKSITTTDRPEPDDEREKVRRNTCENGHEFSVHFRF